MGTRKFGLVIAATDEGRELVHPKALPTAVQQEVVTP